MLWWLLLLLLLLQQQVGVALRSRTMLLRGAGAGVVRDVLGAAVVVVGAGADVRHVGGGISNQVVDSPP